jgi:hypothetical protein
MPTTPMISISQPVRETVSACRPSARAVEAYQRFRSRRGFVLSAIAKESRTELAANIESAIGCPKEVSARTEPKRLA